MAEMIRVPELTQQESSLLKLLSPAEKKRILVEAASGRRKRLSARQCQISFNGTLYIVYEMDRLDLAVQAMTDGKPVIVHRICVFCEGDMYDTPVLRYQWNDACSACEQAFMHTTRKEEENG